MMFNSKLKAIKYIKKILDMGIVINYYRLRIFFEKHSIEVKDLKIIEVRGKPELSLVSIDRFNEDESVNLTLHSHALMNFLPLLYHKKDFLKRYLFGVQSSMVDINEKIFNIDRVFRAETSHYIEWLSSWFGIRYGELIDEKGKRKIVANAVELYKTRGTKEYFIKLIKSLIDVDIKIDDSKYTPLNIEYSTDRQRAFTVIIDKKLSNEKKEELRKYSIIKNIFEKEMPVNTKLNIKYNYSIEDKDTLKEKVIMYANSSYDY